MGASQKCRFPPISFWHRNKLATSEQRILQQCRNKRRPGVSRPTTSQTGQSLSSPPGNLTWLPTSSSNKLLSPSEACPALLTYPGASPLSRLCPQPFLPLYRLQRLSRPQMFLLNISRCGGKKFKVIDIKAWKREVLSVPVSETPVLAYDVNCCRSSQNVH